MKIKFLLFVPRGNIQTLVALAAGRLHNQERP